MRIELNAAIAGPAAPPSSAGAGFGKLVSEHLAGVNDLQVKSDGLTRAFAAGEDVNLHEMVLSAEEARLAMEFTLQVRNKLIDAYQEVMRMQL